MKKLFAFIDNGKLLGRYEVESFDHPNGKIKIKLNSGKLEILNISDVHYYYNSKDEHANFLIDDCRTEFINKYYNNDVFGFRYKSNFSNKSKSYFLFYTNTINVIVTIDKIGSVFKNVVIITEKGASKQKTYVIKDSESFIKLINKINFDYEYKFMLKNKHIKKIK